MPLRLVRSTAVAVVALTSGRSVPSESRWALPFPFLRHRVCLALLHGQIGGGDSKLIYATSLQSADHATRLPSLFEGAYAIHTSNMLRIVPIPSSMALRAKALLPSKNRITSDGPA